jgi:hypothetical protein
MGTQIIYTDDIHVVGELFDSEGNPGAAGKTLVATATGSEWSDVPAGIPTLATFSITNGVAVNNSQIFATVNCINAAVLQSGGFPTISSGVVSVVGNGFYEVSFAITTTSTGARATDIFAISINNTVVGIESNSAYLRNTSGINEGACVLTQTLQLVNGDDIRLVSRREGTVTTAGTTVGPKSVISVRKIAQPATTSGVVSSAEGSEATRNIIIGTSSTPPAIASVFANTIYFQRQA